MGIPTDITFYTADTPNGIKISILLEELGLEYKLRQLSLYNREQKEPWFVEINPNGRIPAITDKWHDGTEVKIFESGAIIQYLIERYDKDHKVSYPYGSAEYWTMTSWLFWQIGGLGPMEGQAVHFTRHLKEVMEYPKNRYHNETRRLFRVLDTHLASSKSGFIVGDRCTVADIASWSWASGAGWAGIDLDEFPHLDKWIHELIKRPGFERGRNIPSPHILLDRVRLPEAQVHAMEEYSAHWVMEGMAIDSKPWKPGQSSI